MKVDVGNWPESCLELNEWCLRQPLDPICDSTVLAKD